MSLTPVPANPLARVSQVKERGITHDDIGEMKADMMPAYAVGYWNRRIDHAAAGKNVERAEVDVDAFVTQVWQEMVEEKLAEVEQAAWERRMDINAVLDPVPVRVDARMRPDR